MQLPALPLAILMHIRNKYESLKYQLSVHKEWKHITYPRREMLRLKTELASHLQSLDTSAAANTTQPSAAEELTTTPVEQSVISFIHLQTDRLNRNNLTRTEAYRQIYLRNSELHWALLAHMVSRNGGWSMTDLKGEFIPHLMSDRQAREYFHFFERCNGLIFQDAFPQLLLYEESKKRQRNLFHLLPAFNVSSFMLPFWDDFWLRKEPLLLTTALIINEQSYIEKRVIQNKEFASEVYATPNFRLQAALQLTQVVFPFFPASAVKLSPLPRLAGVIVESFPHLHERIGIGKVLYSILFGIPEVRDGVLEFVKETPHTGSRADFWEDIFTSERSAAQPYRQARLATGRLQTGAPQLYSPRLDVAWPDLPFVPPKRDDWFTSLSVVDFLSDFRIPLLFDMSQEYLLGLNKLDLAVLTKEKLAAKRTARSDSP